MTVIPPVTTIALRRRYGLWSTTVLQAESHGSSVGVKWQDDTHLVLQPAFGLEPIMTVPVEHVGGIAIDYHCGGPTAVPVPGIKMDSSCPPPYPGAFWDCAWREKSKQRSAAANAEEDRHF